MRILDQIIEELKYYYEKCKQSSLPHEIYGDIFAAWTRIFFNQTDITHDKFFNFFDSISRQIAYFIITLDNYVKTHKEPNKMRMIIKERINKFRRIK